MAASVGPVSLAQTLKALSSASTAMKEVAAFVMAIPLAVRMDVPSALYHDIIEPSQRLFSVECRGVCQLAVKVLTDCSLFSELRHVRDLQSLPPQRA